MAPRAAWALAAVAAFVPGAALAAQHPLSPTAALAGFGLACALLWRWPGLWLFALPALLPLANLAPWTGWQVVDEFDLLLLAALAAGYARFATAERPGPGGAPWSLRARWMLGALAALAVIGPWRGWLDAGGGAIDPFQGAADALNSARVGKAPLQALLLLPLIRDALHTGRDAALQRLAHGMLAGAAVVALAALAERVAFPGLLDFSGPYRISALFWEMHVGGAAIDAYLALAAPFVAWALWSARSARQWALAAAVALLVAYAGLTSFSRGAYLGMLLPLLLLGVLLARRGTDPDQWRVRWARATGVGAAAAVVAASLVFVPGAWGPAAGVALLAGWSLVAWGLRARLAALGGRRLASLLLATALLGEVFAVLGLGGFMLERLGASAFDADSRREHWQRGVALLQGPLDWALGKGAGRLPSHYARGVPQREFSGALAFDASAPDGPRLRLAGPATRAEYGGLYGLTQRVPLGAGGAHRLRLELRSEHQADLTLRLCESHLLYDRACQGAYLRVEPGAPAWRTITVWLRGPTLSSGRWWAPRQGVLTLGVLNPGGAVELRRIELLAADGRVLTANADLQAGPARWWPAAQSYFVPWHIDNLYLEWLIERGLAGLALFTALASVVLARLVRPGAAPIAPFLGAAIVGALTVGLVSSVMDVPRVAWLWLLIVLLSLRLTDEEAPD